MTVPLGEGVWERVADDITCATCCIEFERRHGWSLARAEAWALQHLGMRDWGRTVRLVTLHRMQPPLAAFVSDVLFRGDCARQPSLPGLVGGAVAFVPVPSQAPALRSGQSDHATRVPPIRGGAGLETDLADVPHADRLPGDLRSRLPAHGYVNYLEALAVVQALERSAVHNNGHPAPTLAVLALYPAQAELIRLLMARSPDLAGRTAVRVEVPGALAEQDCDTVFVSLTRSHAHRPVAFGEEPTSLGLALTRARRRLVLFGDVGTLMRRSQWTGPLDHLDEAAANRERDIVAHLLEYAHAPGPCREALACGEGSVS